MLPLPLLFGFKNTSTLSLLTLPSRQCWDFLQAFVSVNIFRHFCKLWRRQGILTPSSLGFPSSRPQHLSFLAAAAVYVKCISEIGHYLEMGCLSVGVGGKHQKSTLKGVCKRNKMCQKSVKPFTESTSRCHSRGDPGPGERPGAAASGWARPQHPPGLGSGVRVSFGGLVWVRAHP